MAMSNGFICPHCKGIVFLPLTTTLTSKWFECAGCKAIIPEKKLKAYRLLCEGSYKQLNMFPGLK